MAGGTTPHFVTESLDADYAKALESTAGNDVDIAGGASTVRSALYAGVIGELTLGITPVLLDGVEAFNFEPIEVLHSPNTTR